MGIGFEGVWGAIIEISGATNNSRFERVDGIDAVPTIIYSFHKVT
jgi:hypothetical protein